MTLLVRSPPSPDIALAPQLAFHEHRHGQDRTASARLRVEALEGAVNGDRQDRWGASTPSRAVGETQMDVQNEATSPLGYGHGGGLANGKDSMNAARCVQGTRGGHDDPSREGALEDHVDPKMDPVLQAAQARADTKAAIAGMQRHWAGLAQPVGDLEDMGGIRASADDREKQEMPM